MYQGPRVVPLLRTPTDRDEGRSMPWFTPWRARARRAAPPVDVVVLDANLRASLLCVRSLGRAGLRVAVVACASRSPAPAFASRFATSVHVVPDVDKDERGYVDAVLEIARAGGAQVVVPTGDASVAALRARRDEVESVVRLALPSEDSLDLFVSKTRTLELADRIGVRVPHGVLVDDGGALEGALDRAVEKVGLPAIVKPVESYVQSEQGAASRLQCHDARDEGELRSLVQEVVRAGGTALVQEWVLGTREAVHVFAVDGDVVALAAQVNERTHPPLGGDTILRRTVAPPDDTAEASRALARAGRLTGYAEVEFRRDDLGRPVLMEVNPRLSASVEVAVRAGADFPLMIWLGAVGQPLPSADGYRTGVGMRWLGGDLRWLVSSLRERGRPHRCPPQRAARQFVTESFRRDGCDYLGWRDVGPAAAALVGLVRRAGRAGRTLAPGRQAPAAPGEG
jgi:predicted ATP-grasp superfamily ATP-dependent carboligase